MRNCLKVIFLFLCLQGALPAFAQQWGISTNGLYWAAATPNIGVEYSFHRKMTVALGVNYNPFTFAKNRKLKHLMAQPELRYWLSDAFKGHYIGIHGMAALFNFGNLPISDDFRDYRFEGNAFGGGITYGYQWIISNRLNIGADIGFGYLALDYDKFYCPTCGERIDHYKSNYFGPTKVGISLIYLLK